MAMYEYLRYLKGLRELRQEEPEAINTTQLERDFLAFSDLAPGGELTVRVPKMYEVKGEEVLHTKEALAELGIGKTPDAIDITGGFECSEVDSVIILSPQQIEADHCSNCRSYLNPMIERVYVDGAGLIRDFTIHEALFGRVVCKSGELNLNESALFPEKFRKGRYRLELELDTASGTVRKFRELDEMIEELRKTPKASILDAGKIKKLSDVAVELRTKLGALTRYTKPSETGFSVEVNSCITKSAGGTEFYFYSPEQEKNILVYFGNNPFQQMQPLDLLVLDGSKGSETLMKLLEAGIFKPSPAVFAKRIMDLREFYEDAARKAGRPFNEEFPEFNRLMSDLKRIETYFGQVVNEDMRDKWLKEFVMRQPKQLAEFAVCPYTNDPVIHSLLPRISWNASLREYHDTETFMKRFENSGEAERNDMLKSVSSGIHFSNQQNNDVNVWLYQNHRAICEAHGIKFRILE